MAKTKYVYYFGDGDAEHQGTIGKTGVVRPSCCMSDCIHGHFKQHDSGNKKSTRLQNHCRKFNFTYRKLG